MEIITAKYAGFCFGVKRAVDAVFRLAEEKNAAHIYTIGELIHNPNVNEKLKEKGIDTLSENNLEEELKYLQDKVFITPFFF